MYKVSVDIDIDAFQQEVTAHLFPVVAQAVSAVAEYGANQWIDAVWKAKLWSVEKEAYAKSIKWQMTGPLTAEIWADYGLADEIENGRPARDLKRYLNTSQRTRVSNSKAHKGQKYLIIPFRHNTPGMTAHAPDMPKHIYQAAKQLTPSIETGKGTRISGSGHLVPQAKYKWGTRLPVGMAPKMKPHHKTDIYSGMVKMNTSAGKGKSSTHLTFRIMGEWSDGWIVPAKPGLFIVRDIANQLQTTLDAAVSKAVVMSK